MWMQALTAVNDTFETKINELSAFAFSERRVLMRVITDAKTNTSNKGSFFFHTVEGKNILFKEKQKTEKEDSGIILSGKQSLK